MALAGLRAGAGRDGGGATLWAVCGDAIGDRREHSAAKTTGFELLPPSVRWTDDTVCTAAVAEAPLDGSVAGVACGLGEAIPRRRRRAAEGGRRPYHSRANSAAMRVSPAGWPSADLKEAVGLGKTTAAPGHDHRRGARGAKAFVVPVRMPLEVRRADDLREVVAGGSGQGLARAPDATRPACSFGVLLQGPVTEALICVPWRCPRVQLGQRGC